MTESLQSVCVNSLEKAFERTNEKKNTKNQRDSISETISSKRKYGGQDYSERLEYSPYFNIEDKVL